MRKIYEPYSQERNRLNQAQRRFVEAKQAQQARGERMAEVDRQVKRTKRRVSFARRAFTLFSVCSFCVIGGGAVAVFGQMPDTPNAPTQQAIAVTNTPRPTPTLQAATWEAETVQTVQSSGNSDLGFVVVPDGFWQRPGVVDAYRAGTPVAVLVDQLVEQPAAQSEQIQVAQAPAVSTPDPRIEQANAELTLAQIQAQIDAAQAEAEAAQSVAQAKSQQAIERSQAVSDRRAELAQLGYSIVFWLLVFGGGAVLFRLVIAPLAGWLIDGVVNWTFARIDNLQNRIAQDDEGDQAEDEPELPEQSRGPYWHPKYPDWRYRAWSMRKRTNPKTGKVYGPTHIVDDLWGASGGGGGKFYDVQDVLKQHDPAGEYGPPTPPSTDHLPENATTQA